LVIVLDTTPPALTCPADIVTINDLDQCGAVVRFSSPIATDTCSTVTSLVCDPASGAFFPVGTTPVRCMAIDAAGNIASCSFTVTVRDMQGPVITCPADIVVTNAHNAWTSTVDYSA